MKQTNKKLEEMTLEELWQLFPIFLTEHNVCWASWYDEEAEQLKNFLPEAKFHHIGSTVVKKIAAKPIIDILCVVNSADEMKQAADILQKHGYIVMLSAEKRISLNKGYTENGFDEKVFHLHIRLPDDADEIFFRDYLNAHADVAKEYEQLKSSLAKKFKHNRDAYTDAKTNFVKKYTEAAKRNRI